MHEVWGLAALWLGLALIATLLSIWLRIATALSEIVVGTVAQLLIGRGRSGSSRRPGRKVCKGQQVRHCDRRTDREIKDRKMAPRLCLKKGFDIFAMHSYNC